MVGYEALDQRTLIKPCFPDDEHELARAGTCFLETRV
jgi:hypothetical protein